MNLLAKTRRINQLLQNKIRKETYFKEISRTLSDVLDADIVIADKHGKLISYALNEGFVNEGLRHTIKQGILPANCAQRLLEITSTMSNMEESGKEDNLFEGAVKLLTTIIPIYGGGERLGTMLLTTHGKEFQSEDLIIGEYGAAVVGFELLRAKTEKKGEQARKKASIKMALSSLSYSELEAVEFIFAELEGDEGVIIASSIADKYGLTRSVIVNGLRKLEGAGIIATRSLGMKGTYIKVLNDAFLTELDAMKV